jgi:hypothetical protein
MGQKGVGKASMVIQAMVDNEADGCAFVEAHQDAEVFRLRLGKALLFEYNEDVLRLRACVRCSQQACSTMAPSSSAETLAMPDRCSTSSVRSTSLRRWHYASVGNVDDRQS